MSVDTVQIWLVDAELPASGLAALELLLDDDERRRVGALGADGAQRRFVAAHGAVRQIVGERLGTPPEQVRWRRCVHGKPELARPRTGLRVNLSHSGELALVALTDRRPIGVDVQELTDRLDARRLAARYFSDVETRLVVGTDRFTGQADKFVQLWVRKEACVKAVGGRLPQGLRLPVASAGTRVLVHDPTGPLPGPFLVRDVPVPPGFRAAVALAGDRPFRITRHRWAPPVT